MDKNKIIYLLLAIIAVLLSALIGSFVTMQSVEPVVVGVEPQQIAGSDGTVEAQQQSDNEAAQLSQMDMDIMAYEQLVLTQGTAENFLALAGLYEEAGMVRGQRDTLERGYRMTGDESIFETLQKITVNAEEENAVVLAEVQKLSQSMSQADYHAQAVDMLTDREWFNIVMPKLQEGKRNYYLQDPAGGGVLYVETGYAAEYANIPYTKAWYKVADDEITYLQKIGNTLQLLKIGDSVKLLAAGPENDGYSGNFTSMLCIGDTGMICVDSGKLNNGVIVGDFTSDVYSAGNAVGINELFLSREDFDMKHYSGRFGPDGKAEAEQPKGIDGNQIVYAYSDDESEYLLYSPVDGEDTADYSFGCNFLGLDDYPEFDTYTPVTEAALQGEVTLDLSQVQVRVFDSVIEWFDGNTWHSFGTVQEYVMADPFHTEPVYAEPAAGFAGEGGTGGATNQNLPAFRRDIDRVPQQGPAPGANTAPSPVQASAPDAPADDSQPEQSTSQDPSKSSKSSGGSSGSSGDSGGSSGSGGSGGSSGGGSSGGGGSSDPGTGNDGEDIGWSGDIF